MVTPWALLCNSRCVPHPGGTPWALCFDGAGWLPGVAVPVSTRWRCWWRRPEVSGCWDVGHVTENLFWQQYNCISKYYLCQCVFLVIGYLFSPQSSLGIRFLHYSMLIFTFIALLKWNESLGKASKFTSPSESRTRRLALHNHSSDRLIPARCLSETLAFPRIKTLWITEGLVCACKGCCLVKGLTAADVFSLSTWEKPTRCTALFFCPQCWCSGRESAGSRSARTGPDISVTDPVFLHTVQTVRMEDSPQGVVLQIDRLLNNPRQDSVTSPGQCSLSIEVRTEW